jgi:hypothetical protein
MKMDQAYINFAPAQGSRLGFFVRSVKFRLAVFSLLLAGLLPLGAVAQITESLLPNAVPPSTPQAPRSAFATIGVRLGEFFWYPRGEIDGAYNSNIFATTTGFTYDLITALTTSFDLLSIFSRNSLNLHGGSLLQVYADHPAQNTQDGFFSVDGALDVTAGSALYGSAQVSHGHISYGSPNSPGNIAQPVTNWNYTATAGYAQGGRRFSYGVDVGVTSTQYNAALLAGGGVLPQSTQDGTASSVAVHGSYEIIPDYLGYVRVGGSLFDYWHTVPGETRPNFSTYRVDVGLQILPGLRHIISGEVYVGYLVQKFAHSSLGSSSTPDYGGGITWSITPRTTLNFSGVLTFNTGTPGAGLTSAGNSYLASVFTVGVTHELLRNLQLGLTATYINNSFQGITRTDNVIVLSAGARYQVNRNLFLGSEISYAQQNSTGGRPFTQNVFTLRAGTQF